MKTYYKNILLISIILLTLGLQKSIGQEQLNSYLEIAANNNPELKMAYQNYLAALEKTPQVKALPDPQLAFAYFISPVETKNGPQNFKISAAQYFPWFGSLKAAGNSSIALAKSKFERFMELKLELFRNVKTSYYDLYFNHKAIQISNENLVLLQSLLKMAEIKIETGDVTLADAYRIEIEINTIENQIAYLKDKIQVLKAEFNNLLNRNIKDSIELPDKLWNNNFQASKASIMDTVLQNNHQLLKVDFEKQALAFRQKAATLKGYPSMKIGLDYTFIGKGEQNLSGKDAFVFPSVGISIPINRKKYNAMIQEVVHLSEAKDAEKEQQINKLENLLEKIWANYLDADRRIHLYIQQKALAQKSLNIIEMDYATSNKNFEELLRIEKLLLKFDLLQEKAISDKQSSIAFIEYLMSKQQ